MSPTDLLQVLLRPGVSEITLVGGQVPRIKHGGGTQPISKTPWDRAIVAGIIRAVGGDRDSVALDAAPSLWTTEVEGVGKVMVEVSQNADRALVARLALANRGKPFTAPPPKAMTAPPRAMTSPPRAPTSPPAAPAESFGLDPPAEPVLPAAPTLDARSLGALLAGARRAHASDLHLVAERPPLVRIAGALIPAGDSIPADRLRELILPVLPERLHDELEKHGAVDFAYQDPVLGRFRVNVNRQRTGLKACFRMIPSAVPTLESLGLPPDIAKATHHHQGLIVVAGPTGHGKTSTLAALVNLINTETSHHIITVEDPVEYVHPRKRAMMSQREVGAHTKSFQAALKGSLREDPDVIVIGELRDTETVRIALTASETGHLVIGTMNTPSASKTIDRLIDLFPPGDQQQVRMTLAGGLRLIVAQRLLPRADGSGMAVAAEVLPGLVPLWNLIRDHKTYQIPSLQQRGKALGIIRLDDSLGELVKSGAVTMAAASAVAESPAELEAIVSGRRVRPATQAPPAETEPLQEPPEVQGTFGARQYARGVMNNLRKGDTAEVMDTAAKATEKAKSLMRGVLGRIKGED